MRQSAGHTLIELMIVFLLLGILSAVAIPAIQNGLSDIRLKTCAERIAEHLRYARTLSMTNPEGLNRIYSMNVSSNPTNNYRVQSWNGATFADVQDPLDSSRVLNIWFNSVPEFQGITIQSSSPTTAISFDRRGRPYHNSNAAGNPPGAIWNMVLQNNAGTTRTLSVYPETGIVIVR